MTNKNHNIIFYLLYGSDLAYRNKSIHYNCNFRMVKRHRKTRNHVRHIGVPVEEIKGPLNGYFQNGMN